MSDKKTLNFCPECGDNQVGNKFCSNCGYTLLNDNSEKIELESENSKTGIEDILTANLEKVLTEANSSEVEGSNESEGRQNEVIDPVTKAPKGSFVVAITFYLIFAFIHCFIAPGISGEGLFNDLALAFGVLVFPYVLLVIIFSLFKSLFNFKFVLSYSDGFFGFSLLCEFLIVFGALN